MGQYCFAGCRRL